MEEEIGEEGRKEGIGHRHLWGKVASLNRPTDLRNIQDCIHGVQSADKESCVLHFANVYLGYSPPWDRYSHVI